MKLKQDAIKRLEIEVKLDINKKLFEKGYITEEMYIKAKQIIITVDNPSKVWYTVTKES